MTLYTIGHSNLPVDTFWQILQRVGVTCVIDVRNQPVSRYTPQYNDDRLRTFIVRHGGHYLNFCRDFGPRHFDCIDSLGLVSYERVMQMPYFVQSAARVVRGLAAGYGVVLMCAEADPLMCHRFCLLGRYFQHIGVEVVHLLKDGRQRTQLSLEREMVAEYLRKGELKPVAVLFDPYTDADQLADAYRLKNAEIR